MTFRRSRHLSAALATILVGALSLSTSAGSASAAASATTPSAASIPVPVLDAGPVEVGQSATSQVSVTNIGNDAAAVWPPSFTGPTAGDWSAAESSTCYGAELVPSATCIMDVVFTPSAGDQRLAVMSVPAVHGPVAYEVSLTGVGVSQPSPPTDVKANGSVFGTVLTWGLPTSSGGAVSESATIEKTADGGLSWSNLATVTGTTLDSRTYADSLGVAPGAEVGYRVSTTQTRVAPGQTTTYSSEPSAMASATGARQSLVVDGISSYDGYRPITLRGSMNPDVPIPGFFLPSTDGGPWTQSPDGSEIIMASAGAGTAALPWELRRRPALGRTGASTPIYAGAHSISEVTWSPDGKTLAWREYHYDNSESYLMVGAAAGGSVRNLNLTSFSDFQWLPDSRTLVGISNVPIVGSALAFVNTGNGALTSTRTPAVRVGLAPDARRLVTTTTDANLRNEFFDIYTFDPNTRILSAAVRTQKPYLGISHVEFSPNGRELLTSQRYVFARWPLTSGNVVLDPGPNTQARELSSVRWHTYRPTLAPSPATTGPTATFQIAAARMAPGTTYQCAVDDRVLAGCRSSWATPTLTPGRHTVRVLGTEPSGRSVSTARTWNVTAPTRYTAVNPRRVMDTRAGLGAPRARIVAGGRVTLTIPGLPAGATAATLNVTAIGPTTTSYLTVYPAGSTRPTASNLNFVKGQTVANLIVVKVSGSRQVTFDNSAGTVDVVADLAGYYAPTGGALFGVRTLDRIMDTRIGLGASGATAGPGTVSLVVPGLPAGTTAVALNVTVTRATAASYLTVYPGGTTRPTASNLNFVKGQTVANLVVVRVGTGGRVSFYNNAGAVDILADLAGVYTAAAGTRFTALAPTRVLDTRRGLGAPAEQVTPGIGVTVTIPDLPDDVTAVALTVTATRATTPGYLTVDHAPEQNWVSSLNYVAGQTVPNLVIVGVGPDNTVRFSTNAGSVDVIADLAGFFRP
jgi:WD40 repeat protein